MLGQLLLYSKMNQLYVSVYALCFGFPSHLGHHRGLSRVPVLSHGFYIDHNREGLAIKGKVSWGQAEDGDPCSAKWGLALVQGCPLVENQQIKNKSLFFTLWITNSLNNNWVFYPFLIFFF